MSSKIIQDNDVSRVLKDDGVDKTFIGEEYENLSLAQFEELKEKMGEPPWAVRIVYNKRFGGVLYIFLRGMIQREGVFFFSPRWNDLLDYEKILSLEKY